jgi:hypothetical protein
MARFSHPGKRICERWPTEARHCVNGAVITGEGERRVGQRQQMCYLVTIPKFGDGVAFHIVKNNFRVEVAPKNVFANELIAVDHTVPPPVNADHASQTNVAPNVFGGTGLRKEIAQL